MTEPTGYTPLDLIGFTDRGDYSSSETYVKNDLVTYDGTKWRCKIDDTTGQTPAENTYWTVFIEGGGGTNVPLSVVNGKVCITYETT